MLPFIPEVRLCAEDGGPLFGLSVLHSSFINNTPILVTFIFSTNEGDITFMRCGWWRQARQVPVQADRGKIVPLHQFMSLWESCGCPHADRWKQKKARARQASQPGTSRSFTAKTRNGE